MPVQFVWLSSVDGKRLIAMTMLDNGEYFIIESDLTEAIDFARSLNGVAVEPLGDLKNILLAPAFNPTAKYLIDKNLIDSLEGPLATIRAVVALSMQSKKLTKSLAKSFITEANRLGKERIEVLRQHAHE